MFFGTRGTIEGVLLNGERFDFPGSERDAGRSGHRLGGADAGASARHRGHRESQSPHLRRHHAACRAGSPTAGKPVTAEHARHVIEIIESGYRAAETGRTQPLATTFQLRE